MPIFNPVSTYRLQFNKDFTFRDALYAVDYLNKIGVRSIYASPVFEAVKGSTHGYNVTQPLHVNPELGTEDEFAALIEKVHRFKMGWIQDIVPNHMAFSTENPWMYDVLKKGRESEYYHFFDIAYNHHIPLYHEKLMLPFFGGSLDEILEANEISLIFNDLGFHFKYFESEYPVSYTAFEQLFGGEKETSYPFIKKWTPLKNKTVSEWDNLVEDLIHQYKTERETKALIDGLIESYNNDSQKLEKLILSCTYIPVCWKETESTINYRRFFTINGLICLNMQNQAVFDAYHQTISKWVKNGTVQGLRVDHVDGLYNPTAYIQKLREDVGKDTYLVVEKILEKDETIDSTWPIQGSTGYDFLGMVNNLLTNTKNMSRLHTYYKKWNPDSYHFSKVAIRKKRFILYNRLKGELDNLTHEAFGLKEISSTGFDFAHFQTAIGEFLVHCPVYKIYQNVYQLSGDDREILRGIFHHMKTEAAGKIHYDAVCKLAEIFLSPTENKEESINTSTFFRHCMQYTGPLMAKGIEDTAFYSYNPFIAHNEVGDTPGEFGISKKEFHRLMIERKYEFPLTMNATATHDTKRGEDARTRLNVLSDVPDKWISRTKAWREINQKNKQWFKDEEVPSANDEYFIYQTLCGHLPMNGIINDNFRERLQQYITKVLREAKESSSWSDPDYTYESNTLDFIKIILSEPGEFINSYLSFMKEIISHGIINSITQVILKNTVPGVPDTFQGSEGWNLSFVDPDNRSQVDFESLSKNLKGMKIGFGRNSEQFIKRLWEKKEEDRFKQWVSYITLKERNEKENLFLKGTYLPLKVKGKYKKHIIAYCRHYQDEWLLVVLPLKTAKIENFGEWKNTRVLMPDLSPVRWTNKLTGEKISSTGEIRIADLFSLVPFGILSSIPNNPIRRAGVLMHVSSLPGKYGIGGFGEEAMEFIDFLSASGQRYWQVLPLNITSKEMQYSPYSSFSAFAGNTLFLDPEQLTAYNLISADDIPLMEIKSEKKVDFYHAEKIKNDLLSHAFEVFKSEKNHPLLDSFKAFKERENHWIYDFGLFMALKQHFENTSWFQWPDPYKNRDTGVLQEFRDEHAYVIEYTIFAQFLFSLQWGNVKNYANQKGIQIFGDLPIYVSYDSADVWAHPEFFRLKNDKSMEAVAGVPPDYFNANGQLWGMPLYNWDRMKKNNFSWWISRIKKNLEWFDLLRLDHFRGFSAYWEVPAGDKTAIGGKWTPAPGIEFFERVRKEFPDMPLVAEDLGQIDQDVYDLRDAYDLPGMKVLQFGFGTNMPFQQHVPNNHTYNSIAYSGTHDNNTMKGWYRTEVDKATLKRYEKYTGNKLKEDNCHLEMIHATYASVSKLAIIPMQDWLGLDEKSRMNFPSTTEGNWLWRMKSGHLSSKLKKQMQKMTKLFGRY